MVSIFAFALEQHVGFANGIGLRVDFLAIQVTVNLQSALGRDGLQRFFGHREHAARTTGIVKQ
jgi:hypothetical protein